MMKVPSGSLWYYSWVQILWQAAFTNDIVPGQDIGDIGGICALVATEDKYFAAAITHFRQ